MHLILSDLKKLTLAQVLIFCTCMYVVGYSFFYRAGLEDVIQAHLEATYCKKPGANETYCNAKGYHVPLR